MKKTASTFRNMVVSLFLVTLIASIILSCIFNMTKKPITSAKLKKKLKAINAVTPPFTNNPNDEQYNIQTKDNLTLECYPARQNNDIVGTAVKSYSKQGYSGLIWIMVGFDTTRNIHNITILEHKETPGLGDKMKKPRFINQFLNKNPEKSNLIIKKDGGEIDAITAATITSRAFCDAVSRAYKAHKSFEKTKTLNTNE